MRGRVILALVLLATGGCASTRLTVNLDLYRDDARGILVDLTPARIAQLTVALSAAETDVDQLAKDRIDLAMAMTDTYEAVRKLLAAARGQVYDPNSRAVATAREYLGAYRAEVDRQRQETHAKLQAARQRLDDYVRLQQAGAGSLQTPEAQALQAIGDASRALAKMGGPLGTDFEKSLVELWPVVIRSVSADNLKALESADTLTSLEEFRGQVANLGQQLERLRLRGRRVPLEVTRTLAGALKDAQPDPGRLKASIDQVARAMTAVPASLGLDDRGAAALHDLVLSSTLLSSQIDRLQDPADPVWRAITAPESESRWNTTFAETYFYSEGNNSVVIVRDTPFSFRVQRGTNNPAALVQGQLQISRAVANAAIAVAGAAAGVPVPKLPGAGGAAPAANADDGGTEAEALAKRKATVERQAALRAAVVAGLRRQLGPLRAQLDRTDAGNRAAVDAILSQMRSVLEAHETALAPK